MKYNPALFKALSRYLKRTNAKWCILGATERDNRWYMFLYDTITHKRRDITYLLDLMVEHRILDEILTIDEIMELLTALPTSYAERLTL